MALSRTELSKFYKDGQGGRLVRCLGYAHGTEMRAAWMTTALRLGLCKGHVQGDVPVSI